MKEHYNKVIRAFDLQDKIFKLVGDQASNVKKAFSSLVSAPNNPTDIIYRMIYEQPRLDNIKSREASMSNQMTTIIAEANYVEPSFDNSKPLSASEVMNAWNFDSGDEELTDTVVDDQADTDDTDNDCEEFEELDLNIDGLAYFPSCANNLQLVISDGLNSDKSVIELIDRISSDIVSKAKFSNIIAEELRTFDKKLASRNATRWNSTLFMIRSVLKVTPTEFVAIKATMLCSTAKQKEVRAKFGLKGTERDILQELHDLLVEFKWATDELQGDRVTISRILPSFNALKDFLVSNIDNYKYK